MNEPRLILIEPKSRNLIIANLDTMRKRQVILTDKNYKFPCHFEFIEVKHRLIICGGIDDKGHFLADSYKITIESKMVQPLANMEIPKNYH